MKKKNLLIVLGFIISIFFIYLAFKSIDFKKVWLTLKNFNLWYTFLGILAFVLANAIRGYRWQLMLKPIKKTGIISSITAIFIDILGNNILPARVGDLWRVAFLKQKEGISATTSASALVLERLLDALVIVIFAAVGQYVFQEVPSSLRKGGIYFLIGIIGLGLIFFVVYMVYERKLKHRETKFVERVEKVVRALHFFRESKLITGISIISIVSWAIEALSYYYFLKAFGYVGPRSLALIVLVAVNIGVSIPSAPGYFGVYEYSVLLAFYAYGLPKEMGVTYAFISHALRYLTGTITGLLLGSRVYLIPTGQVIKELEKEEKQIKD